MAEPRDGRSREAAGIGAVLDGLLGGRPWRTGLVVGRLARAWPQIVGDRLAAESAPIRLDDAGVLYVRASTAAWATQLKFLGAQIADGANRALGADAVAEVRAVVA